MIKTVFSIVAGIVFAVGTLMLVAIYWLVGLLARATSFLFLPLRRLAGKSRKR